MRVKLALGAWDFFVDDGQASANEPGLFSFLFVLS